VREAAERAAEQIKTLLAAGVEEPAQMARRRKVEQP
jgi:hypothetical protein